MFTEVEFRLAGGDQPLILVPGSVNDRGPFFLILDTGAGTSLVSKRLAGELGIVATGSKQGHGAAGRVMVEMASAASLAIGSARRAPMPLAITAEVDRIGACVGERIDGDVGYDFLRDYRVTIDYQRRTVRLAQGAYDVTGGDGAARSEVPFRLASPIKPLTLVPAFVNGRGPYQFALDTGASMTTLSSAVADTLRVAGGERVAMAGAGGTLPATVGHIASLAVGGAMLDDLTVVVADFLESLGQTVGATLDGIVGYNFLKRFRVTIDYPNGVLWLVRAA